MAIGFGSGITTITSFWTEFLAVVQSKGLLIQYQDDGNTTTVFAFDGPSLVYSAVMYDNGNVPSGLQPTYSVTQNNSDLTDFQTNWQSTANQRLSRTDRFGNPVFQEFDEAVAMGAIPNAVVARATGYVAAPTLNTYYNVLSATYVPQTSAVQRSLKSSSTSDATGGTGAITVQINYLNNSMVLKQDTVTLNGTTAVNTNATDIQFIESMVVQTCGSNLANVGAITMYSGTAGGGSAMAVINIGDNQTFYCHHYVPAGVKCYIRKHTGAATLSVGRSFIVRTGDPRSTLPVLQIGDIFLHSGGFTEDHEYDVPLIITGPDRILAKEYPVASNSSNFAYASFDYSQF